MWHFRRLRERLGLTTTHTDVGQLESQPPPELGTACEGWRQGDVFLGVNTFVFDHDWDPKAIDTPHGAAVISQTCDASRPERTRVQIAPVVRLEDANDLLEASSRKRTQYVPLPCLGPDFFADLEGITTVMKTALVASERVAGVETDEEVRDFAFSVARRFGRFAYPDDVVLCLKPLTDALRSKARKENTPLGKALNSVHSFRVHCTDWSMHPHNLTLIVILEPGVISSDLDEIGPCPNDVMKMCDLAVGPRINSYAEFLNGQMRDETARYFAWQYLAEAWAEKCEETVRKLGLMGTVGSITAEIAALDDFPLSRYLKTESLDLDYLSSSRKAAE